MHATLHAPSGMVPAHPVVVTARVAQEPRSVVFLPHPAAFECPQCAESFHMEQEQVLVRTSIKGAVGLLIALGSAVAGATTLAACTGGAALSLLLFSRLLDY